MSEAAKNDTHLACLCLGSNIEPETNLRKAIHLLRNLTSITAFSTAWETRAVGAPGDPNYLNACLSLTTQQDPEGLTSDLIRPVEAALGRVRSGDKNAPRSIDIDLVLYDGKPLRLEYWEEAFMLVPLAELLPQFIHPTKNQRLEEVAEKARKRIWILKRPDVLMGV